MHRIPVQIWIKGDSTIIYLNSLIFHQFSAYSRMHQASTALAPQIHQGTFLVLLLSCRSAWHVWYLAHQALLHDPTLEHPTQHRHEQSWVEISGSGVMISNIFVDIDIDIGHYYGWLYLFFLHLDYR